VGLFEDFEERVAVGHRNQPGNARAIKHLAAGRRQRVEIAVSASESLFYRLHATYFVSQAAVHQFASIYAANAAALYARRASSRIFAPLDAIRRTEEPV